MRHILLQWRNPNWGGPDLVCPHCGTEWNVDEHSEYGYFMLEDGTETVTAHCDKLSDVHVGCDKDFKVIRKVILNVSYKVCP